MRCKLKKVSPVIKGVRLAEDVLPSTILVALRGERVNELRLRVPKDKKGHEEIGVIITRAEKVYVLKTTKKKGERPTRELIEKVGVMRIYATITRHNRSPPDSIGYLRRDGFTFLFNVMGASQSGKNPISKVQKTVEMIIPSKRRHARRLKAA